VAIDGPREPRAGEDVTPRVTQSVVTRAAAPVPRRASDLARRVLSLMVRRAGRRRAGRLRLEQAGRRPREVGSGDLAATLRANDPAAYAALVWGGSKGLGRSYVEGLWESEDLTTLMRLLYRVTTPSRERLDALARALEPLRPTRRRRAPRPADDRRHVGEHYDLSNDLFALMLDESLAYSCAIFADEGTSLHDAQVEKFDRLCRKLALRPGDRVVEIGTGWGGFALHAAARYGVEVTTTTLSVEQRRVAEERVRAAGLAGQVTVLGEHYRDLTGTYDALVSIEMIEAVDWRHYDDFFARVAGLLAPSGRAALQAITIAEGSFDRAKRRRDFIAEMVFPGGCLPSVSAMTASASRAGLGLVDLEDIGVHYPRTLGAWRENLHAHAAEVAALGLDERFTRLWDLYLAYCEAAFLEGHISDVQMVLARPGATPVAR
jgi:cyclopropane-fatty-acyl-phospholipid synthase